MSGITQPGTKRTSGSSLRIYVRTGSEPGQEKRDQWSQKEISHSCHNKGALGLRMVRSQARTLFFCNSAITGKAAAEACPSPKTLLGPEGAR